TCCSCSAPSSTGRSIIDSSRARASSGVSRARGSSPGSYRFGSSSCFPFGANRGAWGTFLPPRSCIMRSSACANWTSSIARGVDRVGPLQRSGLNARRVEPPRRDVPRQGGGPDRLAHERQQALLAVGGAQLAHQVDVVLLEDLHRLPGHGARREPVGVLARG